MSDLNFMNLTIKIPHICECSEKCYCKKGIVCTNKCICSDVNFLKVFKISSYGPQTPDYETPMKKKIKKSISFDKEIHILEFKENDITSVTTKEHKLKIVYLISPRSSPISSRSPRSSPRSPRTPKSN
jgi:hypothetical protein